MPIKHYENISDQELESAICGIIESRCKRCGIDPNDLLGDIFNMTWIKHWIRAGMPLDRRDQDFKYEALMTNCREELLEKLSS